MTVHLFKWHNEIFITILASKIWYVIGLIQFKLEYQLGVRNFKSDKKTRSKSCP